MDRLTFESANPILDEIADKLDEILDSDDFSAIRLALARLSEAVGSRYSVKLNVCVDIFDAEQETPAIAARHGGIESRRIGMAQMQIAVGAGRKSEYRHGRGENRRRACRPRPYLHPADPKDTVREPGVTTPQRFIRFRCHAQRELSLP